ncbi:MAG: MerR family transcriptional regulator [Chitinophagaceae bacterium]
MAPDQITFDFNDPSEKKENKKKSENVKKEFGNNLNSAGKIKSPRGRKNLKDIVDDDSIEIPEDEILFKKVYYSIGDVSKMFNENASLIRYWENEFDILKPKKNAKGDRFFRPEDVKNLKLIHHLLRQRKYTIEGAKEFLKSNKTAAEKFEMIRSLQKLKSFLNELKASL